MRPGIARPDRHVAGCVCVECLERKQFDGEVPLGYVNGRPIYLGGGFDE